MGKPLCVNRIDPSRLEVNMSLVIVVDVDESKTSDEMAMDMAKGIAGHPNVVKVNVYDDGHSRERNFIPADELNFERSFTRHIGAIGGPNYGG